MNGEQSLAESVEKSVNSFPNVVQAAEDLAKLELPKSRQLSTNASILADYISEFQFDWDNEAFDDEDEFAAETITKVKQILTDIKIGNQYKKIFSAELAYSRLNGDDYSYRTITEKMSAKTVDEAIKEKDEILAKAPKQYLQDKDYALEDVRVRVKIVDQKDNTVLEEKFLLN